MFNVAHTRLNAITKVTLTGAAPGARSRFADVSSTLRRDVVRSGINAADVLKIDPRTVEQPQV